MRAKQDRQGRIARSSATSLFWATLFCALVALEHASVAQTFTVLKHLDGTNGACALGGVAVSSNTTYGTTWCGGTSYTGPFQGYPSSGWGTVFKVDTDGSNFGVIKYFTGNDGYYPASGVVVYSNLVYGDTRPGGTNGYGVVYQVGTGGGGYKMLWNFSAKSNNVFITTPTNSDGANPYGRLVFSDGTLYGTAISGGGSDKGTVFKITTNGGNCTVLKDFSGSDGANPTAGLVLSGNMLYGTTQGGGASNMGTIFRVDTNGNGFTILKNFSSTDGAGPGGADVYISGSGLTLVGSTLYGVGGDPTSGNALVYKIDTNGSGFAVLKRFNYSEGAGPGSDLVLSGNTLYGTLAHGGRASNGVIFQVNTDGSGFVVVKHFSPLVYNNVPNAGLYTNSDGVRPYGLTLSGGTLYGTTYFGGNLGCGTVFAMPLPLVISSANANFGVTNQQVSLVLTGPPGSNVVVSSSSNLQSWLPVATNTLTNGSLNFTDTLPANTAGRYYRANLQ